MRLETIQELDATYFANVFGTRTPVCFDHGEGIRLYDTEGTQYYDFFAGIAVNALGYGNPKWIAALCDHLQHHVLHTSNLYYVETQALLAQKICCLSCADKIFFSNSGAEANEGAIKLAKLYHYKKGNTEKNKIITLQHSFHGRTLATVAATGQEKYQKPYHPLTPGFIHVPINDWDALERVWDDQVAAIFFEPIQGESGVYPLEKEYLQKVRERCTETDALLILDEVQTGMGRTGYWFAYQAYDIEPDIFTLAKALGNGVPIGAVCAKDAVAQAFAPGDHGSTFGGNSFACRAGLESIRIMEEECLVEHAQQVGAYFKTALSKLNSQKIREVRGRGLMLGVAFTEPIAADIQKSLFSKHYLTGRVGDDTLRILPPLIVTEQEIDAFIDALKTSLEG